MMDSMKQMCKLAARQANIALENVANIRACLRVQVQNLNGEARKSAIEQREVLDAAEEALSLAINLINQAKQIRV